MWPFGSYIKVRRPKLHSTRRNALLAIVGACTQACTARAALEATEPSTMKLPRKILPDLAWSFKEPLPTNPSLFVAALRAYGESVKAPVVDSELQVRFPLASLDIEYTYARRSESGAWVDVPVTVRVRRSSPPTYAELLFELHFSSAERLHEQDHSYFEGLWLLDKENEKGVPVYELYLGS
jgi:hypothetical protein